MYKIIKIIIFNKLTLPQEDLTAGAESFSFSVSSTNPQVQFLHAFRFFSLELESGAQALTIGKIQCFFLKRNN